MDGGAFTVIGLQGDLSRLHTMAQADAVKKEGDKAFAEGEVRAAMEKYVFSFTIGMGGLCSVVVFRAMVNSLIR